MMNFVKRFVKDEDGATMVEYGLLAALISIACIATLLLIGPRLNGVFVQVLNALPALAGG